MASQMFSYTRMISPKGEVLHRPLLPLQLTYGGQSIPVEGLLDTGADVNVLPYSIGLRLGAVWDEQRIHLDLSGNLARFEARGLLVDAQIDGFLPVRLAFAWSHADGIPVLLGQTNFFAEYEVCFFRVQLQFQMSEKSS